MKVRELLDIFGVTSADVPLLLRPALAGYGEQELPDDKLAVVAREVLAGIERRQHERRQQAGPAGEGLTSASPDASREARGAGRASREGRPVEVFGAGAVAGEAGAGGSGGGGGSEAR